MLQRYDELRKRMAGKRARKAKKDMHRCPKKLKFKLLQQTGDYPWKLFAVRWAILHLTKYKLTIVNCYKSQFATFNFDGFAAVYIQCKN